MQIHNATSHLPPSAASQLPPHLRSSGRPASSAPRSAAVVPFRPVASLSPQGHESLASARVLCVDDSLTSRLFVESLMDQPEDPELILAASAEEAFERLGLGSDAQAPSDIDLVLMDLHMPGISGIEACARIRADARLRRIPVMLLTADTDERSLDVAFAAGVVDFVAKPVRGAELRARVTSALRLKLEMDRRRQREADLQDLARQLETANDELLRLSCQDGLTGITNRRGFDEYLAREWARATRECVPLSVILIDVDHFKLFNDRYGHLSGDDCLRKVAAALKDVVRRPGDLVARYGGEEFIVVLPGTDAHQAAMIAEALRANVEALAIPHAASTTASCVTASLGVASVVPIGKDSPQLLIDIADRALYRAKRAGRNQCQPGAVRAPLRVVNGVAAQS